MDAIESITPRDALYMLQGSAVSHYWATGPGGGLNAFGLSPGTVLRPRRCCGCNDSGGSETVSLSDHR